jgi:hypothetical protein
LYFKDLSNIDIKCKAMKKQFATESISFSLSKPLSNPGNSLLSIDSESTTSANDKSLTVTNNPKQLNIGKVSNITEKPISTITQNVISPFKPPTKTLNTSLTGQCMFIIIFKFFLLFYSQ